MKSADLTPEQEARIREIVAEDRAEQERLWIEGWDRFRRELRSLMIDWPRLHTKVRGDQ